ncbi:transmembrane protein, putative [Medicago truncatula]|uniref:Transmembrane protein, putative n=1 Tax=Medicago truncatula TaxID=3880 RepID=A0A072TXS6_MEDTR|nr:transmembrane protein, putative [Medicago truncatula]
MHGVGVRFGRGLALWLLNVLLLYLYQNVVLFARRKLNAAFVSGGGSPICSCFSSEGGFCHRHDCANDAFC